jgi:hypothetical protein
MIAAAKFCIGTVLLGVGFASSPAAEPIIDVYVSTGDNHFLGSSLPIDSPASIEATFDLFKNVNHARRIYWRGLEEASWVSTMHARPENCRYYSLWEWLQTLYAEVKPDQLAVKAAHARGMEIWGMGSLWDWGAAPDTPGFGDYPFCYESKLRLEHPEWAPADRHGVRRQGGPIELAYPEARKALVDLTVKESVKAGYDGICFLTYVENYSLRFADEFGYSEPIVSEFKQRYKLDIRTEPFRRGASREDWLRLRGSYVTAFLRELKAALDQHRIKLGMVVNSNDPRQPQSWNVPELVITAGSQVMDVDTWVREGLVDALLIYGNNSGQSQLKALDDLLFLARGTKTEVSVLTSGPFREGWKPYQTKGVPTVLAVSDDVQHLERGFVPEQTADGLRSPDVSARMRALQQGIAGSLSLDPALLLKSARSANLIERRLALQALGKQKTGDLQPLLAGLEDAENGVRCVAALALGARRDPAACAPLLQAIERHDNHMLRECVIIALRRMQPVPVSELSAAAIQSRNPRIREVAMRALLVHATPALLPVFRAGLQDPARFPRFAAAEALGNIAKNTEAIEVLLGALEHADPVVVNRAAVSLGKLAALRRPETQSLHPKMLAALIATFRKHADATRADAEWGWRPIGNAILEFGDDGVAALRRIRDDIGDPRLADLAWRVVDLTQRPNTFSTVTAEENEAAMRRRPIRVAATLGRALQVDPVNGRDTHDGLAGPVKTIARAIRLAQPGDTIHLAPGTYHESADLTNKHGLPGKPITLDGHGAVLDGSEPVRGTDWESLGQGLFRRIKLLPRLDDAIIGRWFFLWNGRMNHMGRTSKGPSAALKQPSDLQPGEWTYVKSENAFYLRLPEGQTLDAANIRYPARGSAVIQSISGSHLVVRNLTGTHVYNDGFNIHGAQRKNVFLNIAAIECGDDGFSAHEDAECRIDGFVSIGNSTGLCDTVSSVTHYRNVYIKDCLGYDIYFIGDSPHSMENVIVESTAARALEVSQHTDRPQNGPSSVILKNVLIRRVGGKPGEARVSRNGKLTLERCTFLGVNFTVTPGGELMARHTLIGGDPKPNVLIFPNTLWQGEANRYDFASLRVDQASFTAKTFADFQKLTGSEVGSSWAPIATAPQDVGADESALASLRRQ